ncbi:hypothetical protein C7N43_27715 [Sphingobacteriales bacterium UPWRP_1]|nr:hypothetical protein B6N25_16525 [Sphingobacteriales bacterium TSM_CSS]PSJ73718.1 hypothetical protein C7N43_27715 [Sphingobacteriales bacterium UPWRP_1]
MSFKNCFNISSIFATLLFFFLLVWLNACTKTDRQKPDVSNINVQINIERFEKDLFACDTVNYAPCFDALQKKYPYFYNFYIDNLLGIRQPNDTGRTYQTALKSFIGNANLRALYDSVMLKYPDAGQLNANFTNAFRYCKYYFPNKNVPRIVTHISEFGPAAATFDTTLLAISLDMFLGKDFVYYSSIGFPKYVTYRLQPPFIVPNGMKAWFKALYDTKTSDAKLIDRMVAEGKMLYFLDMVLPDTPDSLKIGYTAKELQWCFDNEKEMWAFFIERDLLYSSKSLEYMKFISEGPTTTGMPPESPGQTGVWMGWQIVRKFMQENPNVSFDQLMQITDGQEILKRSKYKPGKK